MRKTAITCVLALLVTRPVFAQEWTEYKSVGDGFQAQFPGQPRVVETTWKSQAGFSLPARVYSAERGRERYSVTVADYSGIEALGKEKPRRARPARKPASALRICPVSVTGSTILGVHPCMRHRCSSSGTSS